MPKRGQLCGDSSQDSPLPGQGGQQPRYLLGIPAIPACRGPHAASFPRRIVRRQRPLESALPCFEAASMFPASGPTQ
jgi:hypothetical protein